MLALLVLFLVLRLGQQLAEHTLAALNRRYWSDPARQAAARRILRIPREEERKAVAYAIDRYQTAPIAACTGYPAHLSRVPLGCLRRSTLACSPVGLPCPRATCATPSATTPPESAAVRAESS